MKIFQNLVSLIDITNLIKLPYTSYILYTMVRVYILYAIYIYMLMVNELKRTHLHISEKKRATGPAQRDLAPGRGPRISRVMMMDANSALRSCEHRLWDAGKICPDFFGMQICMYIIMYIYIDTCNIYTYIEIHVIYIYIYDYIYMYGIYVIYIYILFIVIFSFNCWIMWAVVASTFR